MNGVLAIASIIDLTNKLDFVGFYFKEIYNSRASRAIEGVTSLWYDFLVDYQDKKVEVPLVEAPISSAPTSDQSIHSSSQGGPLKKIVVTGMQHIKNQKEEG